jgi:hypothetical protein
MTDAADLSLAVLKQVGKLLDRLTTEQLMLLVEGDAELAFISPEVTLRASARRPTAAPRSTANRASRPSLGEVMERLSGMKTAAEAETYLAETNFTVSELRELGKGLNVTIQSKALKAQVISQLAVGAVGYRRKYESVMGGSYER